MPVWIFTVAFFFITSDFSIHLMHFTLELQTPITFIFVNENNNCGFAKSFLFFAFSTPLFLVGETLHVDYKKSKIKSKFTFFCKYQISFISSDENRIRTSAQHNRWNVLGIYLKKVNILYVLTRLSLLILSTTKLISQSILPAYRLTLIYHEMNRVSPFINGL